MKSLMSSPSCPVCSWLLFLKEMVFQVEEGDSKDDTLACDGDAHKANVCT